LKQKNLDGFQSCPFSAHCLRLIDDLDAPSVSQQFEEISITQDIQDEYLLAQLRLHVPDCPTCTAVLSNARRVRSQQRAALYGLLQENESNVPSMIPQIFAAIYHKQDASAPNTKRTQYYLEELAVSSRAVIPHDGDSSNHKLVGGQPATGRPLRVLRNAFSLATVAALIFAAIGIFGHMYASGRSAVTFGPHLNAASNQGKAIPTASLLPDRQSFSSFVVGLTLLSASSALGVTSIYNYDAATGKKQQLGPPFTASSVQLDGITPDGQSLLLHYVSGNHVVFQAVQPGSRIDSFYQLSANDWNAGNAIWIDDTHVLIAGGENGVVEVDTQTGSTVRLLPAPKTIHLAFYRTPYLYYVSGLPIQQGVWPALYRIDTTKSNASPQRISMRSPGSTYWLSPDGSKIFYLNKGPDSKRGIYAVNPDGTDSQLLRIGDATPIGYKDNHTLMFMEEVDDRFQVVQLVMTPKQKETIVMNDAAPGAISLCDHQVPVTDSPICDNDIALDPYGKNLILNAYYPDGKHRVIFDDLTSNKSNVLMPDLDSHTQVQLPGWDAMNIPVTGSSPKTVPASGQASTTGPQASVSAYSYMVAAQQDRRYTRQYTD
jgi:hypothetical protein